MDKHDLSIINGIQNVSFSVQLDKNQEAIVSNDVKFASSCV